MGNRRVWQSNLNWGKPSLLKNMILTYWASYHPEIGAHTIIHSRHSLPHAVGAPGCFFVMTSTFFLISPSSETRFCIVQ